MNLKKLAAAAALVCTAPAFAAINTLDGDAELFAMVWDENFATYALDLGVSINDLVSLNGQLSFAVAGANWSAFVEADGNLGDYEEFQGTRWAILAVDNSDQFSFVESFPGDVNVFMTSQGGPLPIITNQGVEVMINVATTWGAEFDQRGGDLSFAANTDATVLVGDVAHYTETTQPLRIGNAFGSTVALHGCTYSGFRDGTQDALCTAMTNGLSQAVTVGFDGQAFTVTAVPEPGTYAMLLAGLGAVGFMARRRRV
jgi:hypothetical protein